MADPDDIAPVAFCGSKKRGFTDDQVHNMYYKTIQTLKDKHAWAKDDPCLDRVSVLAEKDFFALSAVDQGEVLYCVSKVHWGEEMATEDQPLTGDCDVLMTNYHADKVPWADLRLSEKLQVVECVRGRALAESLRNVVGDWVPSDFFYNPYRKWVFGFEMLRGYTVLYQYMSDRMYPPEVLLTPEYTERWVSSGFNTEHLRGLNDTNSVKVMLEGTRLNRYFELNNAGQAEAVKQTSTYFWTVVNKFAGSLMKVFASNDGITDPRITLTRDAKWRQQHLVSSANHIISNVFLMLRTVSGYWANIHNLKRVARIGGKSIKTLDVAFSRGYNSLRKLADGWAEKREDRVVNFARDHGTSMQGATAAINLEDASEDWLTQLMTKAGSVLPTVYPKPVAKRSLQGGQHANKTHKRWWHKVAHTAKTVYNGTEKSTARFLRLKVLLLHTRDRVIYEMTRQEHESKQRSIRTAEELGLGIRHHKLRRSERPNRGMFGTLKRSLFPGNGNDELARVYDVIIPPCTSGVTFLCDNCFYLDQLVGTVVAGVLRLINYYANGPFVPWMIEATQFFAYTFDTNAQVRVGDSAELPVRWPHPNYNNLRWLGDSSDKIRFDDLANLTLTFPPPGNEIQLNVDFTTLNGIFVGAWEFAFAGVLQLLETVHQFIVGLDAESIEDNGLLFVVLDWFVLCDYQADIDGSQKRFALGELMLVAVLAALVAAVVLGIVMPPHFLQVLGAVSIVLLVFTVLLIFIVGYSTSLMCLPALPWQFLNDVFDLVVYNLFPKCVWFFSGLIKGSYTNDQCYGCARAVETEIRHCVHDVGFGDAVDNILFMLDFHLPAVMAFARLWIWPLFYIPFLNARFNKWTALNYADPEVYGSALICNYGVTLPWNLVILLVFAVVLLLPLPLYLVLLRFLWDLVLILFTGGRLVYRMMQSLFLVANQAGYDLMDPESEPVDLDLDPFDSYGDITAAVVSGTKGRLGTANKRKRRKRKQPTFIGDVFVNLLA